MENNNSTANATSFVDEYNWYLWNSESFLKWLATKIQDPLQHDTIIDKLAPENLNGKCLQHLTLTDLRSFGLSHGDALLIKDEIIKLQSKYDGGSLRREEERYRQYKQESSLQFDIPTQQYDPSNQFHHETISQSHTYKSAQAPQQQQQIYNGGQSINEDVILKAKDVMSKRFGLSLPEPNIGMKTNYNYLHNNREEDLYQTKQQADHVSSSNQSKQSKLQRKNSLLSQNITTEPIKHGPKSVASHLKSDQFIMKAQMQYAATKDPPLATAGIQQQQNITEKTHHPIPKTIFDSMPPNIQNIVRRRPYLVEKVINAKKGEGGVQSDTTNDSTIPFHLLQGMPPNIQEIALRRPDLVKQLMSSKIANNHDNHASQSLQYGTNVPKTMPVKEPYDHSDEEHVHLLKEW